MRRSRRTIATVVSSLALGAVAVPLSAAPAQADREMGYTVYASTYTACNAELRHARKQLSRITYHGQCFKRPDGKGWYANIIYRGY